MLPWAAPSFLAVKGIAHEPTAMAAMKPEARDALLAAIARARRWLEDLRLGPLEPGKGLGASCGAGTAPADLTVTGLPKAPPYSWAEQESSIGFPQ